MKGMGSKRKREGEGKGLEDRVFSSGHPLTSHACIRGPHGTVCVLLVERRQRRAT